MVTVSGLIYNLGLVVSPWFEGQLAQCLLGILNGNETFAAMAALCAGYLIAIAVVQGSRFIKRLYVRKFANNINRSMKQVLYANLVRKDKVELEQAGTGTLMTEAISDVDACAEGMRKFTTEIFDTGIALLAYAVSALALVVLGLAAPGSAIFFPLVSLWCNLALFGLVLVVLRLADVKFDLFHWAVIIGFWAAALLYFYWAETRRSFVYIWDYVNYINKQYNAEAAFLQGPAVGFHFILDSLAEDYTNFNTLFLEFPFCLTDRTGDSFAICQVFSIVPMLLLLLAGLVVKVGQMLQVKNRFWYFLIGLSWTFTYPWLRMSAVLSQPDWFGLIFAFSILLLTLDFRFEKLDLPRFGLLFLATAAIILSRRWYLYFVVGYYFAYAVLVLVSSARIAKVGRKQEALLQVRNLILFGLMSMVAMVILLWPLVSHILGYDYADHYSYYNGGGMVTETYLQCARMGLMNLVLMGMGLWFCFKRRKMPALPCLAGLEILLSMVLFTRVQTTGSQHMLLFLPGWFLLFLIGAAALAEGMNRRRNLKIGFWLFTIAFATSVRCSPLTTVALPDFLIGRTLLSASPQESAHDFAAIDDLVYDRKDLPQIKAIASWIDTHCADGEIAYMIPHDTLYCPDHFKNCLLPQTPINNKLAFGFSVPGTHYFPMQFFEAKYVLTADPFPLTHVNDPENEMSHKLNDMFLAVRDEYFALEETFDMGNGTTFTIWRRTVAPTRAEVEYYLSAFKEEDAQYPEMFSQIAESWLAARGL